MKESTQRFSTTISCMYIKKNQLFGDRNNIKHANHPNLNPNFYEFYFRIRIIRKFRIEKNVIRIAHISLNEKFTLHLT